MASVLAAIARRRTSLPLQPGRTTDVTVSRRRGRAAGARGRRASSTRRRRPPTPSSAGPTRPRCTARRSPNGRPPPALQPSRALELAAAKAERERQRSQLLASRARVHRPASGRFTRDPFTRRADALDEGRQLRAKLMTARAVLERVPAALYARTRDRLREAAARGRGRRRPRAWAATPRSTCLLCATYAAGGEIEAARLARAHVTEAERADPDQHRRAGRLRRRPGRDARARSPSWRSWRCTPGPGRTDRFALRDLYLANDWDRLRGDPKFESLFPR